MASKTGTPAEEAYLLRVQNPQLAEQIKRMLRNQEASPGKIELRFKSDREGTFICGDKSFPVRRGSRHAHPRARLSLFPRPLLLP